MPAHRAVASALLAAVLFGASTPAAKALVGGMHPVLLAGLLYAGSGIGLALWLALRRGRSVRLQRSRWRVPVLPGRSTTA